jgi:hypothetical protein
MYKRFGNTRNTVAFVIVKLFLKRSVFCNQNFECARYKYTDSSVRYLVLDFSFRPREPGQFAHILVRIKGYLTGHPSRRTRPIPL